ncbi:hypothetical protein PPERSA_10538 [Pseudocohnilembus persalinus]|uniref:Uncharacterized protein n=1 Tax=Pseudocohnilembus persalinus TaxID=266149 RepID=A0A0V0QLR8_PSEPJ|nr:hypothetical protein PPERSA_10538 [Pseudocohnilembus persalinus]|eukprot:KRX03165.1 hypothetical protein PPERSA_10538 [Pseudocohnilembus persalinus]
MLKKKFGKKDTKVPSRVQNTTTTTQKTQENQKQQQNLSEEDILKERIQDVKKLVGNKFSDVEITQALKQNNYEQKKTVSFLLDQEKHENQLQTNLLYSKAKTNNDLINISINNNSNNKNNNNTNEQNSNNNISQIFQEQNQTQEMKNIQQQLQQLKIFQLKVPKNILDDIKINFSQPSPDSLVQKQFLNNLNNEKNKEQFVI